MDISRHLMLTPADDEGVLALFDEGRTGLRSGAGFYQWDEARRAQMLQRRAHQLRHAFEL